MENLKIIEKKTTDLIPYENNPRHNDEAVEYVKNSIKQFGFKVPIIVDKDNVIIAGHTRLKAAKELGMETVPCIMADDLTPEQVKAFRLADNKVAEYSTWDIESLEKEFLGITNIDMENFGFLDGEEHPDIINDETYNNDKEIPQYEIQGEKPPLKALVDEEKYNELMVEIDNVENVPEEVKCFLRKAATRHFRFNYKNIAEYYAHAPQEVQELMENSALVLIDIDNAIRQGYVRMNSDIEALMDYTDEGT